MLTDTFLFNSTRSGRVVTSSSAYLLSPFNNPSFFRLSSCTFVRISSLFVVSTYYSVASVVSSFACADFPRASLPFVFDTIPIPDLITLHLDYLFVDSVHNYPWISCARELSCSLESYVTCTVKHMPLRAAS
ncbi:uncharacterized protein LACBIDRAFT_296677 [Laccaria bicolor S238N-H82]|uniref:Predicted protein n=1 Tax=Laccaria bicolor (strain S238N-H82 / ATCC MYA-4686) TaxID=486041 RepID=B0D9E4_LACBS|nr:uncharacterized protein LACBIDRAFT_296677 [Laccaria bicolor S238N-H82]EDR09234.1 predicted protein [Laccaria bicolor S238N-H82]|eukprot:XP_001880547.1 predicted protein [Laccaria bicolor S238N-H82]